MFLEGVIKHVDYYVYRTPMVKSDIYPGRLLLKPLWSPLIRGKTRMERRCLSI